MRKRGREAKRQFTGLEFHSFVSKLNKTDAMDSVAKELAGHSSSAINTQRTRLPVETLSKAINRLPEFQ